MTPWDRFAMKQKDKLSLLILVWRLHPFVKTDKCNIMECILTCGHNVYLQTCRHENGVKSTVELQLKILMGTSFFLIPWIKKSFQWGLCKNQTENYYCSYKSIISILNLNLMVFFFYPFCIYTFVFIVWDLKKNFKFRVLLHEALCESILLSVDLERQ